MIERYLDRLPLVAILRGVTPDDVVAIAQGLLDVGFAIVEVPLNSPNPIESVRRLAEAVGDRMLVGAGTVTSAAQVEEVKRAGGRLIVSPHLDVVVVRSAKAAGLACIPGVASPSEGFAALSNGADALKLFPAELLTPTVVRALRSVFPPETKLLPVGGITPAAMAPYVAAGASGFGLGSALYRPGDSVSAVTERAREFVRVWDAVGGPLREDHRP